MLDRADSWSPCAEALSEFKSPNPVDVLRLLARRPAFTTALLERLKRTSASCALKISALLELTLDIGSKDALRTFLDADPRISVAAAVLLARLGALDEVLEPLKAVASEKQLAPATRRRVGEVIAENGKLAEITDFIHDDRIDAGIRLMAALTAWRRFRAPTLAAVITELIQIIPLKASSEDDVTIAAQVLEAPINIDPRNLQSATAATILVAASRLDSPPMGLEVMAGEMLNKSTVSPEEKAAACVALLAFGSHLGEDAAPALLFAANIGDFARERLLIALGRRGAFETLEHAAAEAKLSVPSRCGAARELANAGRRQDGLRRLHEIRRESISSDHASVAKAFFALGELDEATATYMEQARVAQKGWALRGLMEMGRTSELVELVSDETLPLNNRLFGVRCIRELGAADKLQALALSNANPLVRLSAADALRLLGWYGEAHESLVAIARSAGLSPDTEPDQIRLKVAMNVFGEPATSATALASLAQQYLRGGEWRSLFAAALKRPETTAQEAVDLMTKLEEEADLNDVYTRVVAAGGGEESQLLSLGRTAARRGQVQIALQCLLQVVSLPSHNLFLVANVTELLLLALRRASVVDPNLSDGGRLNTAEELAKAGSPDVVALLGKLATDETYGAPWRLRAATLWHQQQESAETIDALVASIQAIGDVWDPPVLPSWLLEACEIACSAGRCPVMAKALNDILANPNTDLEVRYRAAALLGNHGDAATAAAVLVAITDDCSAPLPERVQAASRLGGFAPEQAQPRLIGMASTSASPGITLDDLIAKRTAARRLVEIGFYAEGAAALLAMRDHPVGDDNHRTRCDELWGLAVLGARRAGKEIEAR
jgi:hypothetical protein